MNSGVGSPPIRPNHIGILGGTFNPVHIGHIRLALEIAEALGLEKVLLTPCARPPHKSAQGLLDFETRVQLLSLAIQNCPRLGLNTLEARLIGPSYTYHSLCAWKTENPDTTPYFILGAEDFAALPTWHKGLSLPHLALFVVVPRAGSDWPLFQNIVHTHWAGSTVQKNQALLPGGSRITFLKVPRLDISASDLRTRWLAGHDLTYLVPRECLEFMEEQRGRLGLVWGDFGI